MNSLETEYSFLAPTWKLPSIGTPSLYNGMYDIPYLSPTSKSGPDMSTAYNTTMYNSRYVPPNTIRRTLPPPPPSIHQKLGGRSIQNGTHEQIDDDNYDFTFNINSNDPYDMKIPPKQNDNRGHNHPQPTTQKRVQIIDHNRHTPSTDHLSGRDSRNSYNIYSPDSQQKSKPRYEPIDDNKSDATFSNVQRSNNFKIHEYLYGLSAPDPGSYVNAYRNQQRRVQDEKVNRKSVMHDYKNFVQNGGFGPAFGSSGYQTFEERLDTEKKRKTYSKIVRETNHYKVEEQKRAQNNNGQARNGTYIAAAPKLRRPDALRSHFLSAQETYGYADHIEKHHYLRPWSRSERSSRLSIISTPLPSPQRLRTNSFDNLHPWNQADILSGELCIDRTSRSSSISTPVPRRVRFHSRDFIRRRSSTFIDLPTGIIGTKIVRRPSTESNRFATQKSRAKILEENDQLAVNNHKHLQSSTNHHSSSSFTSNIKEKKFITSRSMMNSDIQSPPTAILKIINEPYNTSMASTTTSTNTRKPILIIRSPENSSKSPSRNVRFEPEIINNDDQISISHQTPLTTQPTPGQPRKLPTTNP